MYLPEINAFLVPAEHLVHAAAASQPQVTVVAQPPTVKQPAKRRRPVANFVKYVYDNFPSRQNPSEIHRDSSGAKKIVQQDQISKGNVDTEINVNRFYGSGLSFYGSLLPQVPYSDFSPKISELDRTLSENDRLLEKISGDLDETTMILMGQAGKGGTRLTLRPVAKAVAGPRGVAVASPIAQAVLRRKDPAPEITYEPDSVAVAGPGGQAYSHPKLVVTYLDDVITSTPEPISDEGLQNAESVTVKHSDEEPKRTPSETT